MMNPGQRRKETKGSISGRVEASEAKPPGLRRKSDDQTRTLGVDGHLEHVRLRWLSRARRVTRLRNEANYLFDDKEQHQVVNVRTKILISASMYTSVYTQALYAYVAAS